MTRFVVSVPVLLVLASMRQDADGGATQRHSVSPSSNATSSLASIGNVDRVPDAGEDGVAGTYRTWSSTLRVLHLSDPWKTLSELLRRHPVPLPASGVSERCRRHTRQLHQRLLVGRDDPAKDWVDGVLRAIRSNSTNNIAQSLICWAGDFNQCVKLTFGDGGAGGGGGDGGAPTDSRGTSMGEFCFLPQEKPVYIEETVYSPIVTACFPSSCVAREKQLMVDYWTPPLPAVNKIAGVTCSQQDGQPFDSTAILMSLLLSVPILLAVVGTTLETKNQQLAERFNLNWTQIRERPSVQFLSMFSVRRSWKSIFDTSRSSANKFQFMEGIRFLSIVWIIVMHSHMPPPGSITSDASKSISQMLLQLAINKAQFAVDTFFYMSGFCAVYFNLQSRQLAPNCLAEIPRLYLKRFLRVTPSFACAVAFMAGPLKCLGNGPFWPLTVIQADTCRRTWWTNLLYVQNLIDRYEICVLPTWYLMADMQMYLLVPPIIILFVRKPRWSLVVTCLALVASESAKVAVYTLTYFKLLKVKRNIFLPWMRASPYFIGMLVGMVLQLEPTSEIRIKTWQVRIGWVALVVVTISLIYWDLPLLMMWVFNPDALILFVKIVRSPLWSLSLVWITLVCTTGNGGLVNRFLSCDLFAVLGRLTYGIFITHWMVQKVFYENMLATIAYTTSHMVIMVLGITLESIAAAIVLYMLVEYPMTYFKFTRTGGASGKIDDDVSGFSERKIKLEEEEVMDSEKTELLRLDKGRRSNVYMKCN